MAYKAIAIFKSIEPKTSSVLTTHLSYNLSELISSVDRFFDGIIIIPDNVAEIAQSYIYQGLNPIVRPRR